MRVHWVSEDGQAEDEGTLLDGFVPSKEPFLGSSTSFWSPHLI